MRIYKLHNRCLPRQMLIAILCILFLKTSQGQFRCIDCSEDSINHIFTKMITRDDSLNYYVLILDNIGVLVNQKKIIADLNALIRINKELNRIDSRPYEWYRDGMILWENHEKENGIDKLKKAIELFDQQRKIFGHLSLLNLLREYFNYANKQEERLAYYQGKLDYYQKNGPIENTAACYHSIAGYFAYKAKYNMAISYYLRAAEVYKTFSLYGYYYEFSAIGTYYYLWGNYDKSKEYLQASYDWFLKAGSRENVMGINVGLALVAKKKKNYQEALFNIDEALHILDKHPIPAFRAICLAEKGGILLEMNQIQDAFPLLSEAKVLGDSMSLPMVSIQGDFEADYYLYLYYQATGDTDNAEKMLLTAYRKATEAKLDGLIQKYRKALFMFYSAIQKSDAANSFAFNYIRFNDSLFSVQNATNISDFEKQQQEKESQEELHVLQLQKIQQRNYFIIAGVFLLLVTFAAVNRLQFMRKTKKQLEEKNVLIENEKLRAEQSERFKQQFLANMSHEIRTPMNAVMGMTGLLIDKNPRDDQMHYLDGIRKSSETLLHIINDILDLSKVEAGKIELEQIDFSLHEVVAQVEQMLLQKAEESGIKLIVEMDKNIPILMGDPVRIFQVLMNLVGNSLKFTEEGYVKISVKKLQESDNSNVAIRFSIIDTGIGIPKDKIDSIFEKFSQAHASDTRKYGGTGLGLSISKQLIELLGGTLNVESEEGTGSIFSFQLKFKEGSAEGLQLRLLQDENVDGSILNGLNILLVDDNDYNLIVASDSLQLKASVQITKARNGREAIEQLRQNDFDVILMDVQMPEMNGLDATRFIRKHFDSPKCNIPIIALTASVLRTDLDRCNQAGMNAYISKPFKSAQLIKGIAKTLNIQIRTTSDDLRRQQVYVKPLSQKSGITNLNYLSSFCEGDKERMKKYIRMFIESADGFIHKTEMALLKKDYIELADLVHSYKTKWIMMGMNETKEMANQIEKQCREQSLGLTFNEDIAILIEHIRLATGELSLFCEAENN